MMMMMVVVALRQGIGASLPRRRCPKCEASDGYTTTRTVAADGP